MATEMNCYEILHKDEEHLGVGYTLRKLPLFLAPTRGEIRDWKLVVLELRDGDYPDYLASNYCMRICSEQMRAVLDAHATNNDHLQWLDVIVKRGEEERKYYHLHFPAPPNVLDRERTIYAGDEDFVIQPVLSRDAVTGHNVFTYPASTVALIVTDPVRADIKRKALTGMEIMKMPIV